MRKNFKEKDVADWGTGLDPLEKDIEKKVGDYAKKLGVHHRKWRSPSRRSVPDRLFFFDGGHLLVIEFKRKGKKATPDQQAELLALETRGFQTAVIDNIEDGCELILNTYERAARRPEFMGDLFL